MSAKLNVSVEFHVETCSCGGTYAISEDYRDRKYTSGGGWRCPYCNLSWGYFGNSENEKLKKQLAEETARKNIALSDANTLRAEVSKQQEAAAQARSEAAKLKKRAAHGVCPCCTRTFANVSQHMQLKHPEFVREQPKKAVGGKKPRSDYVKQRLAEIGK